jgi:hypothetical protein
MSRDGIPKPIVRRVLKAARKAGWRIELGGKHYRCYPADPNLPVMILSTSPSSGSESAIRDDCRKRGLAIDGRSVRLPSDGSTVSG